MNPYRSWGTHTHSQQQRGSLSSSFHVAIIKTFNITQLAMLFVLAINLFEVNYGESISSSKRHHTQHTHTHTHKCIMQNYLFKYIFKVSSRLFICFPIRVLRNLLGNVNETIAHSCVYVRNSTFESIKTAS